ncbi:MAG: manganese efflux pump [Acidobacteria bacterium]|nr:manganese efflux pump [Acidobacteriota bacterium]
MSFLETFILALALATDAFSVGAAVGLHHRRPRQIFRLSWHFGIFQSLMAFLGWLAGRIVVQYIGEWDHWLAAGVLILLGLHLAWEGWRNEPSLHSADLTRGFAMVGLSMAVSIDALAAGLGLAVLQTPLWLTITLIGLVALAATAVSMLMAARIARYLGRYGGLAAGLVLIVLGIRVAIVG